MFADENKANALQRLVLTDRGRRMMCQKNTATDLEGIGRAEKGN